MTEQQIIESLATKVMGWEVVNSEVTGKPRWFYQPDKQFCLEMIDWNPLQNIADAWMIVEKIKDNDEQKRHFSAWLALTTGTNSIFGVTPKAISMAAYRLVLINREGEVK